MAGNFEAPKITPPWVLLELEEPDEDELELELDELEDDLIRHVRQAPIRAQYAATIRQWADATGNLVSQQSDATLDTLAQAKGRAMALAAKQYKDHFTNYLDQTSVDSAMRQIFPFWQIIFLISTGNK